MQPALMLVTAATLGWSAPAEIRGVEPDDLLAAAFVARLSFDAQRPIETVSPEAVALHLWYPPVPATRALDVAGPSVVNPRRDITYDLAQPWFRAKP